ncbi:type 1 glutamine amidotransferase [Paenibacillus mesotrionivorans]|uniref:Type 1 glutamine amidotransferase n=1 Tax=Paenibacillus mesotrionivorans TaxID=3160968 RepID=A0ACC7NST6_9BACL
MRIHVLQHIELEHPGSIRDWARERGHPLAYTRFYLKESLPGTESFDLLLIMGGPMNIYEEERYPWLAAEKKLIRAAVEAGKGVLGICLGSQLIADALGGKVTANPLPEIGWFPVIWNEAAGADPLFAGFPRESVVFHWHYDTFSVLPPGAKLLAASAGCRQQAYVVGDRVVGLQFHLENTAELLRGYVEECGGELVRSDYVQTPEELLGHPEYAAFCQMWMELFLDRLEERILGGGSGV